MEPENPEVVVTSSNVNTKTVPLAVWVLGMSVIALGMLAIGFWLGATMPWQSPVSEPVYEMVEVATSTPTDTATSTRSGLQAVADMPTSTVASLVTNIMFSLPSGWQDRTNDSEGKVPAFLSDYSILLEDEKNGCIAAFGTLVPDRGIYVQASFGERVFDVRNQHDGNWFAPVVDTPVTFSDHTRQYRAGEYLHYYSSSYQGDFVLWAGRNRSVPDSCVADVQKLLASIDYYFPTLPSTEPEYGILAIKRPYNGSSDVEIPTLVTITNPDTAATYAFASLPAGTMGYDLVFVASNTLHLFARDVNPFSPQNSALVWVDVRSREVRTIPIAWYGSESTVILSQFVAGGRTYLTVVPYSQIGCMDKGYCNPDVLVYDHASGDLSLVVASAGGGQFIGLDTDTMALYLRGGWGDAGCVSDRIYEVKGGTSETLLNVSYCFGEEGVPPDHNTAKAVHEYVYGRIEDDRAVTPTAFLSNKAIRGDDRFAYRTMSNFVFTQ